MFLWGLYRPNKNGKIRFLNGKKTNGLKKQFFFHKTEISSIPNQSEKSKYNLIPVKLRRIQSRLPCVLHTRVECVWRKGGYEGGGVWMSCVQPPATALHDPLTRTSAPWHAKEDTPSRVATPPRLGHAALEGYGGVSYSYAPPDTNVLLDIG